MSFLFHFPAGCLSNADITTANRTNCGGVSYHESQADDKGKRRIPALQRRQVAVDFPGRRCIEGTNRWIGPVTGRTLETGCAGLKEAVD
jgi:hypothetical protein